MFSGTLYGGGGGGCGGCGGEGASGGQGGGASIALAVFESGVTLDASCKLTAVEAGAGGNAKGGGKKQDGGDGGAGAGDWGCDGSAGGDGGKGGDSGAGAGGISVGIAYVGTEPVGAGDADITVAATAASAGTLAVGTAAPPGITVKSWKAD